MRAVEKTFLTRRCFEQVAMDLCLHNLPVRLIANGGGLVYAPLGPTHLAIEDIAIMRALPRMTVVAPADKEEMARFIPQTLDLPGPVYIRLAKGGDDFPVGGTGTSGCYDLRKHIFGTFFRRPGKCRECAFYVGLASGSLIRFQPVQAGLDFLWVWPSE